MSRSNYNNDLSHSRDYNDRERRVERDDREGREHSRWISSKELKDTELTGGRINRSLSDRDHDRRSSDFDRKYDDDYERSRSGYNSGYSSSYGRDHSGLGSGFGMNQGSSGYHPGMGGLSSGMGGYHPGMGGLSSGMGGYHSGLGSYGTSGYHSGMGGLSSGMGGYHSGLGSYGTPYHTEYSSYPHMYDTSSYPTQHYGSSYGYPHLYSGYPAHLTHEQLYGHQYGFPAHHQYATRSIGGGLGGFGGFGEHRHPVDVIEVGNDYIIEMDLPGHSKDHIETKLFGNELLIISKPPSRDHHDFHLNERSLGRNEVKRKLYLPPNAESSRINAALTNGVLRITIPKTAIATTGTTTVIPSTGTTTVIPSTATPLKTVTTDTTTTTTESRKL